MKLEDVVREANSGPRHRSPSTLEADASVRVEGTEHAACVMTSSLPGSRACVTCSIACSCAMVPNSSSSMFVTSRPLASPSTPPTAQASRWPRPKLIQEKLNSDQKSSCTCLPLSPVTGGWVRWGMGQGCCGPGILSSFVSLHVWLGGLELAGFWIPVFPCLPWRGFELVYPCLRYLGLGCGLSFFTLHVGLRWAGLARIWTPASLGCGCRSFGYGLLLGSTTT